MTRSVHPRFLDFCFRCAMLATLLATGALAQSEPTASPEPKAAPTARGTASPTPPQQPVTLPQSILPARVKLQELEKLPIYSNGHVGSFYGFCRERLTAIAGTSTYDGSIYGELPAVTVITSLWLHPKSWEDQPLIALKDPDLRDLLALPGGGARATFAQLSGPSRLPELVSEARAIRANEGAAALTPLQSKILDLAKRIEAFQGIRNGTDLLLVPPPQGGSWIAVNQVPSVYSGPLSQALPETVERMRKAFREADPYHFDSALHAFIETLKGVNSQAYPEPDAFVFEVWITKADLGWWAGLVLAIAALVMMLTFQRRRGAGYVISCTLCVVGGALLLSEIVGEARIEHVGFFDVLLHSPYSIPLIIAMSGLLLELWCRIRYVLLGATVLASILLFLPAFSTR